MCTVSFVRVDDSVIITSNRDEHIGRENAVAPDFNVLPDKKIIFPRDPRAGGTWFAVADNGVVVVLLNGAFNKHISQPPYRKSRGLILLEIIEAAEPRFYFHNSDLNNIEPFTVVLYQPEMLYELRWDGSQRYEKKLNVSGNYIWSSSTLYSDEVAGRRKILFEQFTRSQDSINAGCIHDFHARNNGDEENGFVINRQTGMKTFSITQAIVNCEKVNLLHTDLLQQRQYAETMPVNKTAISI
jgi:hypothetical protein